MELEIAADTEALAHRGAALIADQARAAVEKRDIFTLAVSGGRTPAAMFRALAAADVPWSNVHVFQVDERVAPAGHRDRNLTGLSTSLLDHVSIPPANVHAMPVDADDLEAAADAYEIELQTVAGTLPILDLIHLGLGDDGHTASLVPGDRVLDVSDCDVAVTRPYNGWRRMTLTYPALNRARAILWLIAGADKTDALAQLRARDPNIPAGRVNQRRAIVLTTEASMPTRSGAPSD